jgi:hypothetical protein
VAKKKINWKEKAHDYLSGNDFIKSRDRLARGIKYEHMFKKLWEIALNSGVCPGEIGHDCGGHPCPDNKNYSICWRRFRKGLEN